MYSSRDWFFSKSFDHPSTLPYYSLIGYIYNKSLNRTTWHDSHTPTNVSNAHSQLATKNETKIKTEKENHATIGVIQHRTTAAELRCPCSVPNPREELQQQSRAHGETCPWRTNLLKLLLFWVLYLRMKSFYFSFSRISTWITPNPVEWSQKVHFLSYTFFFFKINK